MEINIARENFSQLNRNGVWNPGIVGGREEGGLDRAAGEPAGGGQWRRLNPGLKALWDFLNHQALEGAIVVGAPAGTELE